MELENKIKELIAAIRKTEEYREYTLQKNKLMAQPEIYDQVNDFRRENFELQSMVAEDELLEKQEDLSDRYENLLDIPMVSDFLDAENAFVKLMKEVNMSIVQGIDFE
ncbi:MAG: YlbF family regulator [Lachnospiraceae bacterium]|nr:YlbF family regulator [Lachnospiraceae bacterium]